jgi:hypothetical protein
MHAPERRKSFGILSIATQELRGAICAKKAAMEPHKWNQAAACLRYAPLRLQDHDNLKKHL